MTSLPPAADAGDPQVFRMSLVHRVLVAVILGAMSAVGLVTVVGQLIDGHSIFVPLILFLAAVAFLWWQALMVQPIEISVFADGRLDVRCALRTVHHHVRDVSTVQFRNQRVTFVISGRRPRRLSPTRASSRWACWR